MIVNHMHGSMYCFNQLCSCPQRTATQLAATALCIQPIQACYLSHLQMCVNLSLMPYRKTTQLGAAALCEQPLLACYLLHVHNVWTCLMPHRTATQLRAAALCVEPILAWCPSCMATPAANYLRACGAYLLVRVCRYE